MEIMSVDGAVDMLLALCSRRYSDKERLLIITAWETTLKDVLPEQITSGMKTALKNHKGHMLTPGIFREMCLAGDGSTSIEDDAREAWALVMKNLNSTISPVFKDTAIVGAINRLGGWIGFCYSITNENQPFKMREFVGYYTICRNQKEVPGHLPDRTSKVFQNGKHQRLFRLIGFNSRKEQQKAMILVGLQLDAADKFNALALRAQERSFEETK